MFSIPNENVFRSHISKAEYEFVLYKTFCEPNLKFTHAFSSLKGQKRFGPYPVDLYCEELKTIYQFEGCYFHCHLPPECKDPYRKDFNASNLNLPFKFKSYKDAQDYKKCFETYIYENHSDEVKTLNIFMNVIGSYLKNCRFSSFSF